MSLSIAARPFRSRIEAGPAASTAEARPSGSVVSWARIASVTVLPPPECRFWADSVEEVGDRIASSRSRVRLDQARIDREVLASNQPFRDAAVQYRLK